jgi:hypothetical protein
MGYSTGTLLSAYVIHSIFNNWTLIEFVCTRQVMKHLFLRPSSALGAESESVGTDPCDARLHNMTGVEAENIAYGVIRVCLPMRSPRQNSDDVTS